MTFYKKTSIILDHRPKLLGPSRVLVDIDSVGAKTKGGSKSHGLTIFKSVWTCMVEASVEYSRVIFDLFPSQYLVKLIVSDTKAYSINSWGEKEQCISQLLKPLAALNLKNKTESENDASITHGLIDAVQTFFVCPGQKKRIVNDFNGKGRIICLTSFDSEEKVNEAVDAVCKEFKLVTEMSKSKSSIFLEFVDVVFLHIPRSPGSCKLRERSLKPIQNICITVQIVNASQLISKMTSLVQRHFNLKTTVVTGIPMKEEQHLGGPMNYDVELYHSSNVHYELDMFNIYCKDILGPCELSQRQEILNDTVTLRWCTTPKAVSNAEPQHCIGVFRFTVAEVNSRPAACLVSFLLQGKNVLLEQPKKSGSKLISHILTSHAGDLFIHCLGNSRTPLEDPPSISEGCGGRVTDYRINDFGEFMKNNRLAPLIGTKQKGIVPFQKAVSRLERSTRMWPMVINETVLFNLMAQHLEPLKAVSLKEHLTDEDFNECTKAINALQMMENQNDPLPVASFGFRGKGPKRDEQYRQLWVELETFLRCSRLTSKMHAKLFNYLRNDVDIDEENLDDSITATNDNDHESKTRQAWLELDR
ncbi:integrator complex subunit 13-like isoform X2 [Xenia sp. Carnegie-2017]|uniref:integrator complex subunit 13-like isoform X2 n=1 Tax=Xenia sp. Carnegie-2017 TaxID=2897299 RepID=UPI001F032F64|nr:integrator complex subunit 13-like isoform X2 [Xenia sp. Carnegie-2017]